MLYSLLPNLSFRMSEGKHPYSHHLGFSQRNNRKCLNQGNGKYSQDPTSASFLCPAFPSTVFFHHSHTVKQWSVPPAIITQINQWRYWEEAEDLQSLCPEETGRKPRRKDSERRSTHAREVHMPCRYPPPDFSEEGGIGDSILSP